MFFESDSKSKPQRIHKAQNLVSCHAIEEEEVKEKIEEREGKRSRSFFRIVRKSEAKRCSWNFAFVLKFDEKKYELYAATRADRDIWVKILGTIAIMNAHGVQLTEMTPHEYIKDQKEKAKKILEQELMTETARFKATQAELELQVKTQVSMWLKLNRDKLLLQRPEPVSYESKFLKYSNDFVRGLAYVVGRQSEQMAALSSSCLPVGAIKFFHIEMYLNFKTQMLLVQQKDLETITKITFNEIEAAENFRTSLRVSDFEANGVDPPIWKHCFRLAMKNKPEHVIACASEQDRDEWVRCYSLIIQMKNMGLDFTGINIFTFEKNYKQ